MNCKRNGCNDNHQEANRLGADRVSILSKDDISRIGVVADRLLESGEYPRGVESDLVKLFSEMYELGHYDEEIPMTDACTVVLEQPFKYGRADIVIYHSDGSASVIEAKNGYTGYTPTVSGIGQATMYAVQLANTKGAVKKVRRCLLWSGTGDIALDYLIEMSCVSAGVISLSMPPMNVLMATRAASRIVVEEVLSGRKEEG